MTTSTETTTDLLLAVLADLAPVVGAITPEQMHDPTPCSDFDVEQLREHILGWLTTFADGFADPGGQAPRATLDGYRAPADGEGLVRSAAQTLEVALKAGAAERPLRMGGAVLTGDMALNMVLWEYQMHGWDLARATGQAWQPPAAAAEVSLEFAPGVLSAGFQGEGKQFAPRVEVPQTAPPLDRLLGMSGRDPGWSAA